jgi:RHS repeat-associated protein
MSDKSASASIISLPKGGGTLKGIGEKFSPDLQTGTGNFTIPIALPAGRNGFQPQLNLVYSTGNGSGLFGLGWGLGIPGVTRKTSKGIPRYQDGSAEFEDRDTFILSGAEDLVPVEETLNSSAERIEKYRPRTEGLFANILHYYKPAAIIGDANQDYWQVSSKDGLVSFYGTSPNPEEHPSGVPIPVPLRDPAVIYKPADTQTTAPSHVFAWRLTLTKDPFGSRIEYLYEPDAGNDGEHTWNQPLLKQIRYVDYAHKDPGTGQDKTDFLVTVTFDYEPRPDPFSDYRAGFENRTTKRCKSILIETHAEQDYKVRRYRFEYSNSAANLASLLAKITVVGFDEDGSEAQELPPLEFGYTQFEPLKRKFFPVTGKEMPVVSLANPDYELVDLFGNGLPDIFEMNGTVRYWRNLGNGKFDLPRSMRDAPAGVRLADSGVQLVDANGDGRTDLLVTTGALSGYYPLNFDGSWARQSFRRYQQAPSFNLEDPEVKLVDLDGDGITDVIRSGTRLECFFNDSHRGWTSKKTRWVERKALKEFPNVNFSDPRVKWGDVSGDGLQDIVLVYDGNVEYWPNLGHGYWGRRIHMKNSPRFPYGYDPRRILIGDVDGDGLADIIYVDDRKTTLWINQGGNAWSQPIEIQGTPPVSDMDGVRLVDLLGTGIGGVLWTMDAALNGHDHYFFLDFTGGIKPYLMHEMNNHMGAITRVDYAPSTRFYLEDQKQPATRWKTTLPFPVQVVARVEVIDEISKGKLTTEYRYHHGYWDGAEREFRGFGMVEQIDTEAFEKYASAGLLGAEAFFAKVDQKYFSVPTLTKTWFHLGPIGEEFGDWQEQDWSGQYWQGDPQMLNHTESVNAFLKGLPDRPMKRDALRTLRGSILRTELYALDGSSREDRPYTVTEHACNLREEEKPADPESQRPRIFFPHSVAQRTAQWERGDDPMTQFAFNGEYDDYGQPQQQTQVACPRGWRSLADKPNEPYLVTRSIMAYAVPTVPEVHIHNRVAVTTTYEIRNSAGHTVEELRDSPDQRADLSVIAQTLNYYDGMEFQGLLPVKQDGKYKYQIDKYGALVRSESLVLTEKILAAAYPDGEKPPYLNGDSPLVWTSDYPAEFRKLPNHAGYIYRAPVAGSDIWPGYFAITAQNSYDFHDAGILHPQGLLRKTRDLLDRESTITYDNYGLLPTLVKDPLKLETSAEYDYRLLQPNLVTDPNGNRTSFSFSPMGLLKSVAVMGKANAEEGDTPDQPGTRLDYDFLAFENSPPEARVPVYVHTIKRIDHRQELVREENTRRAENGQPPLTESEINALFPADEISRYPERFIQSREYSDGFGRLLQTRAQGEKVRFGDPQLGGGEAVLPAKQIDGFGGPVVGKENPNPTEPNVVVSGWQIYDNKGRVVEKYEPFFATGWDLQRELEAKQGEHASLFYDPRGQVVRTLNPDGSEQRVIYGSPRDLNNLDPEHIDPTPWEAYTYDANDNAGRTHPSDASAYRHHWNTPASIVIDALGRTIEAVARNRANKPAHEGDPLPPIEEYRTISTYDIQGNVLTVTDALGRIAFSHVYDLAKHALHIVSIDAGTRHIVFDGLGNEIERRDEKGALLLHAYDWAHRPGKNWARNSTGQPITLREKLAYGDGGDPNQPSAEREAAKAVNSLGKPVQLHDEAGLITFSLYDFKGNLLEKKREVIGDDALKALLDSPATNKLKTFVVDWDNPPILDAFGYETSTTYDGLNRVKALQYPQDVDGQRKLLRPHYNRAGALERVSLDDAIYVERIAYNAKGQRILVAYGNGVLTRYAYDPETFRLVRMRTEHYSQSNATTYVPNGEPVQDFAYYYDLAGNILAIHDRTPECGISPQMDQLDRVFDYDPIYRLISATGRECDSPPPTDPWLDLPKCDDPTLTRRYTQNYFYDAAGNMTLLHHESTTGNSFNRVFEVETANNRLNAVTDRGVTRGYIYDANGNLTQEAVNRFFAWDHADRLIAFADRPATGSGATAEAVYLYDGSGQRVKKFVGKGVSHYEVTTYIDGLFEHHRLVKPSETQENNSLHVMDNQSRIALVRVGEAFPGDGAAAVTVKYQLGDHLGSCNVVIGGSDATGGIFINREEYFPYGETSFGSFGRKRYRFTGKERDEESGLNYHGARYYAPWLARWLSCDPLGLKLCTTLYVAFGNNPIRYVDPTGRDESGTPLTESEVSGTKRTTQTSPQEGGGYADVPQTLPPTNPYEGTMSFETHFKHQPDIWDQGGRLLAGGVLTLGVGVLLLASGPVGWGIGLTAGLAIGAGSAGIGLGGSSLALSGSGLISAEQAAQVSGVGELGLQVGSNTGSLGGAIVGGTLGQSVSGIQRGAAIGGLLEAGSQLGFGMYQQLRSPFAGLTAAELEAAVNVPGSSNIMLEAPPPIGGRINVSNGMYIHELTVPTATTVPGATGTVNTRIRVHTPDPAAAAKFPTSNSATGNTMTITQGGRRLTQGPTSKGTWHQTSAASDAVMNESHIPIHRN